MVVRRVIWTSRRKKAQLEAMREAFWADPTPRPRSAQTGESVPTTHTCPTCCQALSYLDDVLQYDWRHYGSFVPWWRHPIWYFIICPKIRDYAGTLLDESGK